ncbi:MAG TPA: glycosyltransferase family 2 protein [Pyrinomonadaceae bacterium]|jgi:glycosyltransferase involved in cell wall biosynthesis
MRAADARGAEPVQAGEAAQLSQALPERETAAAGEHPAAHTKSAGDGLAKGYAPSVSVVIPCYNEERFIGKVLENLAAQYSSQRYEIIVVDGQSTDRTREVISDFTVRHPELRVRLVDNPARYIPVGLNLGIREAHNEIIVRMDAHSVPSENYVRRCVEVLGDGEAAVVGMPWRIRAGAQTLAARAIALAVSHPFGIGDAKYRLTNSPSQVVDTVPFGAFRKRLWEELGGFNEELLANEDYDFHYRVRLGGGRILLDTAGHSVYFARPDFRALATQYSRYGRWKAQMIKLHPESIRLRQLVAPGFVVSLVLLATLGVWWKLSLVALAALLVVYGSLACVCALRLARKAGDVRLIPAICLAFLIIHLAWGSSFLLGLVHSPRR